MAKNSYLGKYTAAEAAVITATVATLAAAMETVAEAEKSVATVAMVADPLLRG